MRVTFLTEFYPTKLSANVRGGVEQRTLLLSQSLTPANQVSVIACREDDAAPKSLLGQVEVYRPGPKTSYRQAGGVLQRLRYAIGARNKVLTLSSDVIIVENFLGYAVALTLPSQLKKRCVLTYHDVWVGEWTRHVGFLSGILGEIIERLVLRSTWRLWIANSEITKGKLVARGISPDAIRVVYTGVDCRSYTEIQPEQFTRPTVTAVARLVAYKHLDDLIRAMPKVRLVVPNAQAVIIGSGPEEGKLNALIEQLGLRGHVTLRGFVEKHQDVLRAVKGSAVFCFPSAVEGMGLVSVEAMACGVPYVSSDIPPTREVTANGQGGILYPVGDIQALADGIIRVLQSPADRAQMSIAGLSRAQYFDWAHLLEQFRKILQDTIEHV